MFRDNQQIELPLPDIVPGDLVFLTAGNLVPADTRVLTSRDLSVNQSALTGEPFQVAKSPGTEDPATPLSEAKNYIFLGTSVVSGTATAIITRTGMSTEFGRVAKTLGAFAAPENSCIRHPQTCDRSGPRPGCVGPRYPNPGMHMNMLI